MFIENFSKRLGSTADLWHQKRPLCTTEPQPLPKIDFCRAKWQKTVIIVCPTWVYEEDIKKVRKKINCPTNPEQLRGDVPASTVLSTSISSWNGIRTPEQGLPDPAARSCTCQPQIWKILFLMEINTARWSPIQIRALTTVQISACLTILRYTCHHPFCRWLKEPNNVSS